MSFPILTPKLYIPRSEAIVARPRLFERLNEGLGQNKSFGRKLTLVAASAGSGKTSLVSAWLRQIDLPVAWLSLDAADSEPTRFINYFVAACQQLEPTIGQSIPDLLQSPQPPPLETMMSLIINDTMSLANNNQWLLVLDDYHLIEDISIHEAVKFLLGHLPPHLHLVIITREDPPLPLPQLRVRRQMTELRANDLRFTTPEIIEFFSKTTKDLNLSPQDIAALEGRTEGWVAGLQLAALSLQNIPDPTGFIKDFAGDDRYVVDYLITEVLERQPPQVLEFLQKTSILRRFTADLCQVLTNQANVSETLAYLEEANLFLVTLDNRREWYRYHHLFGDLLYHRLRQTSPSQIPKLHALAGRWYDELGFTDDALYHALAGEDFDHAADLIEQIGLQMVGQGRLNQLQGWITSLPSAFIHKRPYLSVLLVWINVLHVQSNEAEAQLALIEPEAQNPANASNRSLEIACQVALLRGYITRLRYDLHASITHIEQAVKLLPNDNEFLQCTTYLNLGGSYWVLGNFAAVETPLQQAVTFLDVSDTTYPALAAAGYLTNAYLQRGQLRQAAELCQQVEQTLTSRHHPPPALAYVAIEEGALFYEQNNLLAATDCLSQAIRLGENLDRIVNIGRALLVLAWIKHISGYPDEAAALLKRANIRRPPSVAEFDSYQVRLWLARGNLEAAGQWAETYAQQRGANKPWHGLNELTFACVLLAQNQIEQALGVLADCETPARTAGTTGWVIRGLVLQALCHQAKENVEQALNALQQALLLAKPEGYCRTFIDYGPPVQQLLQYAVAQGIFPTYVSKLLTVFPNLQETDSIVNRKSEIQNLAEPLNDREISILRLMAAGLSNREIADELYLSINTIKWYGSQIYGKLGVKKRAEAIDRAHELGIL